MAKVAVIIAAAGKGERFGSDGNKAFASLDGSPMFLKTLEAFVNRDDVAQTILAVSPGDVAQVKEKYGANLGFMGVQLAEGGAVRAATVRNAVEMVMDDIDLVAIHDAARPCVTYAMIDAVFAEAEKTGAAILAAPVQGTLKRVSEEGVIDATLPRDRVYEAQTPQVFRRAVLVAAFEQAGELDDSVTDDASLVEASGHPVSVVESDRSNLKVTVKADMKLAAFLYKNKPRPKVDGPRNPFEEAQW